jgi:hypothetical protein
MGTMTDVCCGRCNAENPADYTFCFHCGARPEDCTVKPAKAAPKAKAHKGRAKRRR